MTSLVSPLTTSKWKEKETPIQTRTHTHKKRSSLQSISGVWESPGGVRELWEGASNAICVNCTHIGEPSSTHQHYYSSRLGGGVSGAHTRSKGAHINQFGSTGPIQVCQAPLLWDMCRLVMAQKSYGKRHIITRSESLLDGNNQVEQLVCVCVYLCKLSASSVRGNRASSKRWDEWQCLSWTAILMPLTDFFSSSFCFFSSPNSWRPSRDHRTSFWCRSCTPAKKVSYRSLTITCSRRRFAFP